MFRVEFLFKAGAGYDELLSLLRSNPRFVFCVHSEDSIDKRTKKSKVKGWARIKHKQHHGEVKLAKDSGRCTGEITDRSPAMKLTGAWVSWLANNASELIYGVDVRFL